MSDRLVARRYARALYLVSREKEVIPDVEKELLYFSETLKANKDLNHLLLLPRISSQKKKEILEKIFKKDLSKVTMNFIFLLVDKKREGFFEEISEIFSEVILENSNTLLARVKVAFPLSSSEQKELISALSKKTGKKVELEIEEDSSIIGGLIVRVEDKVYDGSLAGQLKAIEKNMCTSI